MKNLNAIELTNLMGQILLDKVPDNKQIFILGLTDKHKYTGDEILEVTMGFIDPENEILEGIIEEVNKEIDGIKKIDWVRVKKVETEVKHHFSEKVDKLPKAFGYLSTYTEMVVKITIIE